MCNFTVDTAHTYFVGEGQWLVHNQCYTPRGWKLSSHAEKNALQRGMSLEQIDDVIDNHTRSFQQNDGGTAFIKKTGRNRYDLVVRAGENIVTIMRRLTRSELRNLAGNYGWEGLDW
jgi:hypothetical protein